MKREEGEGDQDFGQGMVDIDDGYLASDGVCFREVTWMQRRPHLYQTFSEEGNQGSLTS